MNWKRIKQSIDNDDCNYRHSLGAYKLQEKIQGAETEVTFSHLCKYPCPLPNVC